MQNRIRIAVAVILVFAAAVLLFLNSGRVLHRFVSNREISYCLSMSMWIVIPIVATIAIFPRLNPVKALGLSGNISLALGLAFLICLPLLIGFALFFQIDKQFSFRAIIAYSLFASVGEEILFRGFLFGHLYRKAGWGLVLAEFIEALLFGALHFTQGHDTAEALGIFAVTFSGGLWFAWLYAEWNYNLWVPIFIHFLMNAWWSLFSVADNALGNITANVLRGLTIALSVILTLRVARKRYDKAVSWKGRRPAPAALQPEPE